MALQKGEMGVLIVIPLIISMGNAVPAQESRNGVKYVEPEYLDALLAEGRYEEFSKLMGIDLPHLVRPGPEGNSEDPSLNKDLFHGDMLLTPEQQEQGRQGLISRTRLWPNKKIPYAISANYSAKEKAFIEDCVKLWNAGVGSCLNLTKKTNEKDYVYFFNGTGCYSYLGKIGGQQPVCIQSNGCMVKGIILHELEHAIGIAHEHNRLDRDNNVKMLWQNIPPDWKAQYEKVPNNSFADILEYDYYSCMHYPVNAPGTGKPAFQVLKKANTSRIGQRTGFTPTDIKKIRALYRC